MILLRSLRQSLLMLTFATIILAATVPTHALAAPNEAVPMGLAEFNILDFTQEQVTWSLKVTINGNHTSDALAIQTGESTIFEYYAQYDKNLDATIMKKTFVSQFTSVSGHFPDEQWLLQMWFAVNASLANLPVGDFSIQLPTINYDGTLFISSSQSPGASNLDRYGRVYSLVALIERNPGVKTQLQVSMILFPSLLSSFAWILFAVIVIDIMFFLLRIDRIWKGHKRGKIRFIGQIAQSYPHMLNGKYFTIIIGVLFFLPIYEISLRSLETPIPITQGDLMLIGLSGLYGWILLISFVASLITSRTRSQERP